MHFCNYNNISVYNDLKSLTSHFPLLGPLQTTLIKPQHLVGEDDGERLN